MEHNEVEPAPLNFPALNDQLEIELISLPGHKGFTDVYTGTSTRINCTWISAFRVFYKALYWSFNPLIHDTYEINEDISLSCIGSAFADELVSSDSPNYFHIPMKDFEQMKSYFIEKSLMVDYGSEPFTETGRKAYRRCCITPKREVQFSFVEGEITEKPASTDDQRNRTDIDSLATALAQRKKTDIDPLASMLVQRKKTDETG